MLLTPADIHNTEFGKAPLGRRGYDEEEVDALLDEVTQEMIKLLEENEILQRRAGRPEAPTEPPPNAALLAELDALGAELDRARRACDQAEQNAHRLRRQLDEARQAAASAPAAPAPTFGVESPDRVLAMAQRTADDYLNEADQKSRELITDARDRSQRMATEARELVEHIEAESRRFEREAEATLQAQHTALINEIAELTTFAEGYRAALEEHVVRQAQLLEGVADPE